MKIISTLFLMMIILTACGSSYLTGYENVSKTKNPYKKLIVIARTANDVARVKFENQIVDNLKMQGVDAISSFTIKETRNLELQFSEAEIEAIEKKLVMSGIDGAIITSLVNTQDYAEVFSGNSYTDYYPTRVGRFERGYSYYPVTYWEPDRISTGVKYVFESNFYKLDNVEKDNLQWMGRFEIKDPSNIDKLIVAYGNELVTNLLEVSIQN